MGIFKACDIRGVADTELNDGIVRQIAQAIGAKLTGQKVIVGGDYRLSTPRLKRILIEGLVASGCRVIDIGILATPMLYYAVKVHSAAGGVMVTASHNPAAYNGFKMVFGDMPVTEEDVLEIAAMVHDGVKVDGEGSLECLSVVDSYIDYTAQLVKPNKLKLVLDAGNGAASLFAPRLYRACGFEVTELFCTPDGTFPNRPPNPSYPKNLTALAAKVKEIGADVGLAFDGDGDRVGFVDESGRALDNDVILALLAKDYLEEQSGTIVYDAKCSMAVPEEIIKAGGRPVMARAGHTFSKRAFIDEQALFAGEISGHFFFREIGYDDGMFAGLKMCEYIARKGRLSVLADMVPQYILTAEIRVPYAGNDKTALLKQAAENLADYRVNRLDGVRLEFDDGWGMIRSSVTEPIFTMRFEAKTDKRLEEIKQLLVQALPYKIRAIVKDEVFKMDGV